MFFISNALIIVHVLVSFHFTSTVFDSLVFPDLKDVEPAEGRLEFLAYLVNEEQHNQSVQVKNLRKQVPQTSLNTLTQFFLSCHAYPKCLPEFSAPFHFSFGICWYAFNLFYLHLPFEWHVNGSVDRITGPCGFGFGDRLRGWWKRRRSRITSRNSWTHRVSQKVYANLKCEAPTFRVKKKNKALQI